MRLDPNAILQDGRTRNTSSSSTRRYGNLEICLLVDAAFCWRAKRRYVISGSTGSCRCQNSAAQCPVHRMWGHQRSAVRKTVTCSTRLPPVQDDERPEDIAWYLWRALLIAASIRAPRRLNLRIETISAMISSSVRNRPSDDSQRIS